MSSAGDVGVSWYLFTCCTSFFLCSQPSLLWPQYHWPLHLWYVHFVKTCLNLHLHCGPHCACQWWGNLYGNIYALTLMLLLIFYGVILHSLKTHNQEVICKALSVCASHITVVVLFFVPCIFMYVRHPSIQPIDKSLAVFYTIINPMLNRLICTLRNGEMWKCYKNSGPEKENEAVGIYIAHLKWRIALPRKVMCDYFTL